MVHADACSAMKHYQKVVQPALGAAGVQQTLHVTERAGHATELAAGMDLTGCDAIVFMGGDGTVHESLQVHPVETLCHTT